MEGAAFPYVGHCAPGNPSAEGTIEAVPETLEMLSLQWNEEVEGEADDANGVMAEKLPSGRSAAFFCWADDRKGYVNRARSEVAEVEWISVK